MENQNVLNLGEFFSVCSQLVHQAGKIIHGIFDPKGTTFQTKNGDEPFTEADVQVQTLIMKALRKFWPGIKIIGEEEDESETLVFDFDTLRKDLIPSDFLPELVSIEIDLNKAIVWVDPLDGTQGFVKGSLDGVTTLIGIAVEGKAKVGIVGKYFVKEGEGKYEWQPRCYFAHADIPHLHYFDFLDDAKIKEQKPSIASSDPNEVIFATSVHHMSEELKQKLERTNPTKMLQIGGAGNKMLSLINGTADCYFYPKIGLKNWDTCAPEVIMRSVGGIVTDEFNESFHYGEDKNEWMRAKGMIASINKEKHDLVMSRLLKK